MYQRSSDGNKQADHAQMSADRNKTAGAIPTYATHTIMQMQKSVGNRAVLQLMRSRLHSQQATVQKQNHSRPAQMKFVPQQDSNLEYLEPEFLEQKLAIVAPQLYKDLYYKLDDVEDKKIFVYGGASGSFDFKNNYLSLPTAGLESIVPRIIAGAPAEDDSKKVKTIMAMTAHEMQHAVDNLFSKTDLDKDDGTKAKYVAVMDTELRAWATEAIVYKQYKGDITANGEAILKGWKTFRKDQVDQADDALTGNVIWARIMRYSTTNNYDGKSWRDCAKTDNVLDRAEEERDRVLQHVDIQAGALAPVTIDSVPDLETNHPEFKLGDERVKKMGTDGSYTVYKFKRRTYKIHEDVTKAIAYVDVNTEEDLNRFSEFKNAGATVSKVRIEGMHKIYLYKGKEYKVHKTVAANGYFDNASGSWA
ncbi:hypothetical protein [Tumebacillus permanentifrigoris]|uniref:Uncharacterized protein n=1 Tax=Tumebacillus permanentifrigoris TaxID=378543 RepID=A0A316D7C5_9BACL|nr:hypothetical protein [Tumebacillus permanentifrigoris]PWK11557.1 hypothetical protein C7459_11086 [Tumebacillus permanentifrigoris]